MKKITPIIRNEGWILLIVLIAFVLRIRGLNYQSLWLDELHTMNEADPSLSWGQLFDFLRTNEHHPPLFFILERIFFSIFGHTAFVARTLSVIAGTAGIWAMYLLGKELLNKNLGILCALFTCFNFFNLAYSQEARPYALAFLFATLSFTWFIRLVKFPSRKNAISYAIFTLLLLYSHYYSLFVLAAQVLLLLLQII